MSPKIMLRSAILVRNGQPSDEVSERLLKIHHPIRGARTQSTAGRWLGRSRVARAVPATERVGYGNHAAEQG